MTRAYEVDVSTTATPIKFNLGETFDLLFPVLVDGSPRSATGFLAAAVVKGYGSDAVLAQWSTSTGSITCGGDGVTLHFDGTVTAAWTWTQGRFELDVSTGGHPGRLAEGPIIAIPQLVTLPIA